MTQEKITIDTLAERLDAYHRANNANADFQNRTLERIEESLAKINGRTIEHESRIGNLEGRQGMVVRLIFYALGGGGLAGAAVALLAKLGLGDGG